MNDNKIKQVYHHKPILDKPINSSFTEFLYKQVHKLMPILGGGAHVDILGHMKVKAAGSHVEVHMSCWGRGQGRGIIAHLD